MLHTYSLEEISLQNAWLTIGSYDGVHLGHQSILKQLVSGAHSAGAPAAVLAFYPHPAVVLRNRQGPYYLTSPEERAALLAEMGVDAIITHPFNSQVAGLSAQEFMTRLKTHLGLQRLCVGHDFALGRGREGDLPRLRQLGEELGYSLNIFPEISLDGQAISSSRIRAALAEGDVSLAAGLLGRSYAVSGEIVHGDGRGRTIGIPTANLDFWRERAIPKSGVYACWAEIDGKRRQAVVNIGVRPTFISQAVQPQIEAHLLNYAADLYGKTMQLAFIAHLRDEQRFPGIEALVAQIRRDIELARELLGR